MISVSLLIHKEEDAAVISLTVEQLSASQLLHSANVVSTLILRCSSLQEKSPICSLERNYLIRDLQM